MLLQIVASGLSSGSIYALVALALVITYKTTEVPNFAQGEMAMFSAFVAYVLIVDYNVGQEQLANDRLSRIVFALSREDCIHETSGPVLGEPA